MYKNESELYLKFRIKAEMENGPKDKLTEDELNYAMFTSATRNGDLEAVKLLLPKVDPSRLEHMVLKSITYYCNHRNQLSPTDIEIVLLIIKDGRSICEEVLIWACRKGYLNIVEAVIDDPRIDLSFLEYECLVSALEWGHVEVARRLMQNKKIMEEVQNPNGHLISRCYTMAMMRRQWESVRYLMPRPELREEIFAMEEGVIFRFAVEDGVVYMIELLLNDSRIDPTALNNKALNESAWSKRGLNSTGKVSAIETRDLVNLLLCDPRIEAAGNFNDKVQGVINQNNDEMESVSFCCKEIGEGWADLMYTITKGMGYPLNLA